MLKPAVMLMSVNGMDGAKVVLADELRHWKTLGAQGIDVFLSVLDAFGETPSGMNTMLSDMGLEAPVCYVGTDMITKDDGKLLAMSMERIRRGIDACAELGSKWLFNYGGQHSNSGEDAMKRYAENLARVADMCAGNGLGLLIENAGRMCNTADSLMQVLLMAGRENIGIAFDGGNFITCGEEPHEAVMKLREHARHVHVKSHMPAPAGSATPYKYCPTGEGHPDYCFIRDRLLEAGYDGWFAFETEGGADSDWDLSIPRVAEICSGASGT